MCHAGYMPQKHKRKSAGLDKGGTGRRGKGREEVHRQQE